MRLTALELLGLLRGAVEPLATLSQAMAPEVRTSADGIAWFQMENDDGTVLVVQVHVMRPIGSVHPMFQAPPPMTQEQSDADLQKHESSRRCVEDEPDESVKAPEFEYQSSI